MRVWCSPTRKNHRHLAQITTRFSPHTMHPLRDAFGRVISPYPLPPEPNVKNISRIPRISYHYLVQQQKHAPNHSYPHHSIIPLWENHIIGCDARVGNYAISLSVFALWIWLYNRKTHIFIYIIYEDTSIRPHQEQYHIATVEYIFYCAKTSAQRFALL